MRYPLSELLDRYTILQLQVEHGAGSRKALKAFRRAINQTNTLGPFEIEVHRQAIYRINAAIWAYESDIRRGKEGELGLEEVGRRALAIRDLNGERIEAKNLIARRMGDWVENKTDHASCGDS